VSLDVRFFGVQLVMWGTMFVGVILILSFIALHKDYPERRIVAITGKGHTIVKYEEGAKNIFLIAATLCFLAFMFSVRMHERYIIYGLPFMLLACAETKNKKRLIAFVAFSVVVFVNTANILLRRFPDIMKSASAVNIGLALFLAVLVTISVWPELSKFKGITEKIKLYQWQMTAFAGMLAMIVVMFFTISTTSRRTDWREYNIQQEEARIMDDKLNDIVWRPTIGTRLVVAFEEPVYLSVMDFHTGRYGDRPFIVGLSEDGVIWNTVYTSSELYVPMAWNQVSFPVGTVARYVEIVPFGASGLEFQEVIFRSLQGYEIAVSGFSGGGDTAYRLFCGLNQMSASYQTH